MDTIYNALPMSKFYAVLDIPEVKIFAIPTGIRRFGILGFRPLSRLLPYQSQKPIKFILKIEYGKRANADLREFQIRRTRQNPNGRFPGIVIKVHEEDNRGVTFKMTVLDTEEHDDGVLEYDIFFPRTGGDRRLIYSKPLESNFVPALILGGLITLGLTWLWGLFEPHIGNTIGNIIP